MAYIHDDLTKEVLEYLKATGMKPTRFGKHVNNDPSLVASLVAGCEAGHGREMRHATKARIADFMATNPAPTHTQEAQP